MNREELVEILKDIDLRNWDRQPMQLESIVVERTADRILAALAKERENEVVLEKGLIQHHCRYCGANTTRIEPEGLAWASIHGKRGTLIFRRDV